MRWKGRRVSENVEDRRGGGAKVGGISILGLVVAFVAWKFFGVDPQQAYQATQQITQQSQQSESAITQPSSAEKEVAEFVATVLADTEDTWTKIFSLEGMQYRQPKLVMFSGVVNSGCGRAESAMGPFYCPADQKIYIDTVFFKEMHQQLGISANLNVSERQVQGEAGDFAQAYVLAHEVGHHVQNLLGISAQVEQARLKSNTNQSNQLSVRLELQADCFAGVWANQNQQRTQFLEQGDIEVAMDAANKIGDDYLQKRARGQVVPDSFTHGSSQQRMQWFQTGLKSGDINRCNTINANL
ncbi:hypothetical protein EC844_102218 [Acinetobacter calcoaceticus]|uniref:Neutral zinc metallopeptidase n=1 Tax=Acinetobacter calcoaceticus TaxID=471 RepID=A0A4R1Y4Q3_ACICA|nr:hypothetical protein EC844_102218 [Acinetobacter calcoaceticus]